MDIPAFKARFRVVPVAGHGAVLVSEDAAHLLSGTVYAKLVPLIDGVRSVDDIVDAAEGMVDAAVVHYALMRLEAAGYLTESRPEITADVSAFWDGFDRDAGEALTALRSARVRVRSVGSTNTHGLSEALRQFDVTVSHSAGGGDNGDSGHDLDIVLTDDYMADALLPFDAEARATQRRWLLMRPAGLEIWVGPLFEPGTTGCLHCLRHKLARRRRAHLFAAKHDPVCGTVAPLPTAPATTEIACQWAAIEVAKVLAGVEPDLTGTVLSLDLRERSANTHTLIKRPTCAACGDASVKEATPLYLQRSQKVAFSADGGYRTTPPEETLKTYGHLVNPITGVVHDLTPVLSDSGIGGVYHTGSETWWIDSSQPGRLNGIQLGSSGKGMTPAQAMASALGEAIERYSAEVQETDLKIPGSFREMGGDAIHPNDVMNFSDRQYRERDSWNATYAARHGVPKPFDPDARLNWTPLWSLTHQRHRLLPTEFLFFYRGDASERYSVSDSNGCASGNTLEEAVLQGFLELIERDAVAIWWYNRLRRPAIDLSSFDDAWLSNLPARYAAWRGLDRDVVALDLTNDLGVPVVGGVSWVRNSERQRIVFGFGCHLDIRIAVQRAITEMNQMLFAADSLDDASVQLRTRVTGENEFNKWFTSATFADNPYLVADDATVPRTRDDFPSWQIDDMVAGIDICRRSVEARGMEVLVLDQTRSDIGMPAVKVVVPGLRHFFARFGPGRLYDVPVTMGLIDTPVTEEDLNPVWMFF